MGFYLDLVPNQSRPSEFREVAPPAYFWVLYLISVFALVCMALAAHQVLGGLAKEDSLIDKFLVGSFLLAALFLVITGLKFLGLRKFIKIDRQRIGWGYLFFGYPVLNKSFLRSGISKVDLVNKRPASNLAPQLHDDPQYYVQGHWRLVITSAEGKTRVLDKHVEREALTPLYRAVSDWFEKKDIT